MSFVDALKAAVAGNVAVTSDGNSKVTISNEPPLVFQTTDKSGVKVQTTLSGDFTEEEYDIKSVLFCWNNRNATVTEYIEKCEAEKVRVISFMERTDLIAYLKGDIDALNKGTKLEETAFGSATIPVSSDTGDATAATKKRDVVVEKVDYKESKKRKIESDPLLKEISLHEIDLIDHDKALRGTQKNIDFSNLIRECEYKIVRPLKQQSKVKPNGGVGSNSSSGSAVKSKSSTTSSLSTSGVKNKSGSNNAKVNSDASNSLARILYKKDPIIILSPSAISMLTMNNAKSFLQDGKFIDPQSIESSSGLNMVHIMRQSKRFNKKIKFVAVNNVEKFFVKPEYWDRVVAVFTTGQEWQFKNYKINQPNLLFQKVKGFYVNYNGDVVPQNIKNWNVEIISLDRNQRFKDRQISELMWESIERFMATKGYR